MLLAGIHKGAPDWILAKKRAGLTVNEVGIRELEMKFHFLNEYK